MLTEERAFGSLVELREALSARVISPVELMESVLGRISADEPELRAWVEIDAEGALDAARSVDVDAPLGGIPFGVKDVIDVRGLRTRFGVTLDSSPALSDAWCVAAVRNAGAIPIGKLQTTPFAYADPAPTRNPWNLSRTPGGSSSGSAAAVGAQQIPFAFGTQTGGSTLRPAAFNGVVGFKPTFGAIPTPGVSVLSPTADTIGIIARDAVDARMIYAIYDAQVLEAERSAVPRICSGVSWREDLSGTEVCAAVDAALRAVARAGAHVTAVKMPSEMDEVERVWRIVASFEAAAALSPIVRSLGDPLPLLRRLLDEGECLSIDDYRRARQEREHIRSALDTLLAGCDAVALPTAGQVPTTEKTGDARFLRPWTLCGYPSISIPVGFDSDGMPIGVQLIGKRGDDGRLLALACFAQETIALENPGPRRPFKG